MAPIYEYFCDSCLETAEIYQTSCDGGPSKILCKVCGDIAKKRPSTFAARMDGKLITPGGPVYESQKDDIGPLTGDLQERSAKEQRDYAQEKRRGKGDEYIFGRGEEM